MARFIIEYRISGTYTETVEAESKEAAEKMANANCENEDWVPDLDSIDDVNFYTQEMHRVVRDGKPVWTTYVRATDTPSQA